MIEARSAALLAALCAVCAVGVPGAARAQVSERAAETADVEPVRPQQDSAVVEGTVVDATSGTALPGTLVRVVGTARQDVTHEGGEYHLLNLAAGRHTLLFERIGYRREVREVVLEPRQRLTLDIELRPSAIELPGIFVTGTTRPGLGDATVRPANVVAGQDLTRKLDVTLAGTLEQEAGLAVTSIGPATARPVIRGMGGDRVLVLEDGGRVGDLSSASGDHAVSVDPLNAQRIEVVRGPSALLYGSNAIGGVINLIRDEVPSSVPDRATGVLNVQAQSVNRGYALGGSGHLGAGDYSLRGEASHRSAGELRTPEGPLHNTQLATTSLAAGASRVGGWGHAGLAYRLYDNGYGIPGGFVGSHPDGVEIEMERHAVRGEAHIARRVGIFEAFELDAMYTRYQHRELEAPGIIGTEFGLLTAAGEVVARHDGFGPLSGGALGTRVQWRDYAAGGSTQTPPAREWSLAGFWLEEFDAGRFTVQAGVRYDWHRVEPLDTTTVLEIGDVRTRTFGSVSGSVGVLGDLGTGFSAGLSVARAYRTPDFAELFSQGPHLAAYSFEVGNPDLHAETGLGIDVFIRVARDRLHGEIAAFRNRLDNYIFYRDTGTQSRSGLPIYQATGADAVLEGFETTLTTEAVRHLVISGTASYVRGTVTDTDEPLPMMPPLHGSATVRYERPSWFVGVTVRAAADQDRIGEFETATAGYSAYDLDAGLRWVALGRVQSLTLRLDNLTDALIRDHLSRIKDIMPAAGRGASMIYRLHF